MHKRLMIGGVALEKLGSTRRDKRVSYLVDMKETTYAYIYDQPNNIDYYNANGSKFFADIWQLEDQNFGEIASPQALFELTIYAYDQYCSTLQFNRVDEAEFDIKFLLRSFKLENITIVNKYITETRLQEVNSFINSVKG